MKSPTHNRRRGTKTISIAMLTYNDMSHIKISISRILDVLKDDLFEELLILDNGSSDGTREILESLENIDKIRVIFSCTNLGVAGGRRRLFHEAKGDIIASLDSDVEICGAGYFKRAQRLLTKNWRIAICGASGYRVNIKNSNLYLKPCIKNQRVDCVSGFCQIFRREILNEIQVSEEFSPFWCEDTDFCFQALEKGYSIRRLDGSSDLIHTYKSIVKRKNDPLKTKHEQLLAWKWEGRIKLLGYPRLRFLEAYLQTASSILNDIKKAVSRI